MTKEQYRKDLRIYLKGIPEHDIEEALQDIEEYFENGISSGRTDVEIASALLAPKQLAYSIKAEYNINSISMKNSFSKTGAIIVNLLGLGLMNLILLPIFFAVGLLILSFYLTVACFYLTALLLFIAPLLKMMIPTLVSVPSSVPMIFLSIAGVIVLLLNGGFHRLLNILSKKAYLFLLKYFEFNLVR